MSVLKSFLIFSLVFISIFGIFISMALASNGEDTASLEIKRAEEVMVLAYEAVLDAERAGASVSFLVARLNKAGALLAEAENLYSNGSFTEASSLANKASALAAEIKNDSLSLQSQALVESKKNFWFTIASSVSVASVFTTILGVVWIFFKRSYVSRILKMKPEVVASMMKVKDYKVMFVAVGLAGVLICASPSLALIVHLPNGEKFSELYVLGPNRTAEDYPFNVKVNKTYRIYVGVGNHMGFSSYYILYVKFGNWIDPLPDSIGETPSPLEPLYEYRVFLCDNETWEASLNFAFYNVSQLNNTTVIGTLRINDLNFKINKPTLWNEEEKGYYYKIFVELWIYDEKAETLKFHNRFVSVWLNMTL